MSIDDVINEYYKEPEKLTKDNLEEIVGQELQEAMQKLFGSGLTTLGEQVTDQVTRGQKFILSLPRFIPSEAWGDPNSLDRKQIDKIFKVVRGGSSIKARIQYLNQFLDPVVARRKTSPQVIINTMIIIESLKAALNHFNESAAGFVFEGFMAALTGGFQQAERVGGTLPIEDFVAFSEFGGTSVPVSLKLIGKSTYISGSFTNLIDYLFVRGEPAIKYLIVYKTSGGGPVSKLEVHDFDITRENVIDFLLLGRKRGQHLLGSDLNVYIDAIQSGDAELIKNAFLNAPGYTKRGQLNEQTFYEREKHLLLEGAGDTQWGINFNRMTSLATHTIHGELDFSDERFNQLADIYASKLKDDVLQILEATKSLTENIGSYFAKRRRADAIVDGQAAMQDADNIKNGLESQLELSPAGGRVEE